MKQKKSLLLAMMAVTAVIISSCGSNRPLFSSPYPDSRPYVSLIISPSPGFVMSSFSDGRYYHRSQQGFIYWKGYDNRFFLDKKYLGRVNYNNREYNEWRRCYEQNNRNNHRRYSY